MTNATDQIMGLIPVAIGARIIKNVLDDDRPRRRKKKKQNIMRF